MDYQTLNENQKSLIIHQRKAQAEADHYQHQTSLEAAEAVGDEAQVEQYAELVGKTEKLLKFYEKKAKDLPSVEEAQAALVPQGVAGSLAVAMPTRPAPNGEGKPEEE